MQLQNNKTIEKHLSQTLKLKEFPIQKIETFKEHLIHIGEVYAETDEELKQFTADVEDFVQNDGRIAMDVLEKKREKDPAYFLKQWAYLRWDKGIPNYHRSGGFGYLETPLMVNSQAGQAALITYSFLYQVR